MKNKIAIIIVALVIVVIVVYYYMKKSGNESTTTTTTTTKSGLAGLNLTGLLAGVFGNHSNAHPNNPSSVASSAANPSAQISTGSDSLQLDYNANLVPETNYGPLSSGFVS